MVPGRAAAALRKRDLFFFFHPSVLAFTNSENPNSRCITTSWMCF
jgi:hypothetical protein